MGQIADDVADGAKCALCGVYFRKDHGHPVTCVECWNKPSTPGYEDWILSLADLLANPTERREVTE